MKWLSRAPVQLSPIQIAVWALVGAQAAVAAPIPPLDATWPSLRLRADVANLTGPEDAGKVDEALLTARIDSVNEIWSQCAVKLVVRAARNVDAAGIGVPYEPADQGDLSRISAALNPDGFSSALPITVAGQWNLFDPGSQIFLHGLGWVFFSGGKIDTIGAMIGRQHLDRPNAAALVAHEVGHAFFLPHSPAPDNVMAGGDRLNRDQCERSRSFLQSNLAGFLVTDPAPSAPVAAAATSGSPSRSSL